MGTIKATNIEPIANNGTVTLGSSGDTFTVPSGVTVNMSSATQTGVGGANTPIVVAGRSGSSQTISSGSYVKIELNDEILDTGSIYDTSTYTITIGAGGASHAAGNLSVFSTITSAAGGAGTQATGQVVSELTVR